MFPFQFTYASLDPNLVLAAKVYLVILAVLISLVVVLGAIVGRARYSLGARANKVADHRRPGI